MILHSLVAHFAQHNAKTRFVDTNKGATVEHNNCYGLNTTGCRTKNRIETTAIYACIDGENFFHFSYEAFDDNKNELTTEYI